ncbi:MAG: hypothetical protein GTN39_03145 [Candidatus Aenigmarchaeota archaeon]|nr:hypothetical protein [Candidatus Aenigmarchaeota archaeon]
MKPIVSEFMDLVYAALIITISLVFSFSVYQYGYHNGRQTIIKDFSSEEGEEYFGINKRIKESNRRLMGDFNLNEALDKVIENIKENNRKIEENNRKIEQMIRDEEGKDYIEMIDEPTDKEGTTYAIKKLD